MMSNFVDEDTTPLCLINKKGSVCHSLSGFIQDNPRDQHFTIHNYFKGNKLQILKREFFSQKNETWHRICFNFLRSNFGTSLLTSTRYACCLNLREIIQRHSKREGYVMRKLVIAVALTGVILMAGDATAVPLIDGMISGSEWSSGLIVNVADPNEAGIPESYDVRRMAMFLENSGGTSDGLYILFELYGTPTLDPLPELGSDDPFYRVLLDLNRDGIENGDDRRIRLEKIGGVPTVQVKDSTLAILPDTGTDAVLDSVVEIFVPKDMFAYFPISPFDTFARLDNGGEPADDRIPDFGQTSTIPEPASLMLFGTGLASLTAFRRRRKKI